jgi:chromosome segregation ATPase
METLVAIIKELGPLLLAIATMIASITALVTSLRTKKENKEDKIETKQVKEEARQATTEAQAATSTLREEESFYKRIVQDLQNSEQLRIQEISTLRKEIAQWEAQSARAQEEIMKLQATNAGLAGLNTDIVKLIYRVEQRLEQVQTHGVKNPGETIFSLHSRTVRHRITQRRGHIVSQHRDGAFHVKWQEGDSSSVSPEELIFEE